MLINEITNTHTHSHCILSDFWLYEWGISGGFWVWRIAAEPVGVCAVESRQSSELLRTVREQRERADVPFTVTTHTHWAATRDHCCTTGILLQQTANDLASAEDWSHRDFNPGQSHYSLGLFLPPLNMHIRGAFTSPKLCLCSCFFFLLCFHLNLYPSLCREASRDTLQK